MWGQPPPAVRPGKARPLECNRTRGYPILVAPFATGWGFLNDPAIESSSRSKRVPPQNESHYSGHPKNASFIFRSDASHILTTSNRITVP